MSIVHCTLSIKMGVADFLYRLIPFRSERDFFVFVAGYSLSSLFLGSQTNDAHDKANKSGYREQNKSDSSRTDC